MSKIILKNENAIFFPLTDIIFSVKRFSKQRQTG